MTVYETVVKVPGTGIFLPVSVPVNNADAAKAERDYLLSDIIPYAVVKVFARLALPGEMVAR
jgi:hypothetical protein